MDADQSSGGEVRQLISFMIDPEEYGIELLRVKEVIRMSHIMWLPKAPSWVKGIINLRGDVIPIVSLRDRLGLSRGEDTTNTRIIVVEVEGRLIGMIVDAASQVVRMAADQFMPPPPIIGRGAQDMITGVGKHEQRLIILLDVDRILSAEELGQFAAHLDAAKESTLLPA